MVKQYFGKAIRYFFLLLCAAVMVIPFIWMVSTSLKSQSAINKGSAGFLPIETVNYIKHNGRKNM